MENNTSTNQENGNDANRLLAVRAYKCTHCGKIVDRESNKKWIKSYCDETGKDVRLMLVKAMLQNSNGINKNNLNTYLTYKKRLK